jgi:hypothetical protein
MSREKPWVSILVLATVAVGGTPTALGQSASSMERAIALLDEARRSFQDVRDYECTLVSEEQVDGKLMPKNVMMMKCRVNPYSIYLRWQAPSSLKGQEVCYVTDVNEGRMRVHPVGLLGIVGFVSIDPNDPRARKDNRHPITEAGMGFLLENTARFWAMERRLNKTEVNISDYKFDGRLCTRIETIHPDPNAGAFYAYRCVMYLDKATHLPIRVEAHDWPRPGGTERGDLLECYSYLHLRTNIRLDDAIFDH